MARSKIHLFFLLVFVAALEGEVTSSTELQRLVQPSVRSSLLAQLSTAFPAANASCQCSRQTKHIVESALLGQIWALKWVDASARVPSGLLSGNVNQLGDFDECLSLNASSPVAQDSAEDGGCSPDGAKASYCLASVALDLPVDADPVLQDVSALLHSYTPFRSNFSDPGHRVPRFSAAYLGVCVPAACTPADVQLALELVLNGPGGPAGSEEAGLRAGLPGGPGRVRFRASAPPEMCTTQGQEVPPDGRGAWLARSALWWTIATVLFATFMDVVCMDGEGPPSLLRLVHCLSIRQNWRRLLNTQDQQEGEVAVLHGVRGVNALGLLVAHKSVALLFQPYVNRTPAVAVLGLPWSIIGRVAILYTDCFILLSGALVAKSLLRQLDRTGSMPLVRRLIDRYVRLTPLLLALMALCTLVLPGLGAGPMWGMVVEPHAALCRQHWWRNVLYIHNYFGFEDMCLTHTHQLGIDMQLFAIAPLLVYPLWRWPKAGAGLLVALAAWSTALRHSVVLHNELSTIVYFGMPCVNHLPNQVVSQMFKTASISYILPTHRLTVYIMGLGLGYTLHRLPETFAFSRARAALGWLVFAPLGLLPVFGPYEAGTPAFRYDAGDAALYAAFAPILWSAFVCWGIVACARGAGGLLGEILSWRGWRVLTRVSFALYLAQFPVFFYNVGSTRHAQFYTIRHLLNISEFALIMAVSVALSLTFEMPFQELWKMCTERRKGSLASLAPPTTVKPKAVHSLPTAKRKSA